MFGQSLLSAFGSAACTTDTDQLFGTDVQTTSVATYQLNNATTSIPSNTYPGTANNITYTTGKFGDAAVFNGSNADIDVSSSAINTTSPYTISMWLNIVDVTQYKGIFANVTSSYLTNQIAFVLNNGKISIYSVASNGNTTLDSVTATPQSAITNNTWFNLVIIADRSLANKAKVFFNNVEASYTFVSGGAGTASYSNIKIGLADGAGRYFNGYMDQIRFFNSSLPQPAITALYNETTTTAQSASVDYQLVNPNSIAYYKMSNATDQLGSYNGTATNVNFNTEGKFGFAGAFNGSSSIIRTDLNSGSNNLTYSAWINITAAPSQAYGNIVNGRKHFYTFLAIGQNRKVWLSNDQQVSGDTGDGGYVTESTTVLSLGVWYHIVGTLSSTSGAKIYINGNLDNSSPNRTANAPAQTASSCIGSWEASAPFNGKIDQIRIYDSAISAANVTTLYKEIECPAVAVTNAFNTVLYTGNNGTKSITGVGFKPDFTWIKARDYGSNNHALTDSVRGTGSGNGLSSNNTGAEGQYSAAYGYLSAFGIDGFTVQAGSTSPNFVNSSSANYVAWNWKAGGTAVSNTDGTITSQVSANTDAGFSVVSYTGNLQAGASIGHSLGVKPDLIITKSTSNAESWEVWSSALNNGGVGQQLRLNSSNAAFSAADYYSTPDTSKFYVGGYTGTNGNGYTYVSYCFHSVAGYSRVGIYSGNAASGSGTTQAIVTGFRPSWIMVKNTTSGSSQWVITDSTRGLTKELYPDLSNAENTDSSGIQSFNSNGFTVGNGYNFNRSSNDYIFMAIA